MSRTNLFNLNCRIEYPVTSTDDFGQYINEFAVRSINRCSYRDLTGNEIIALGLPVSTRAIRVYLDSNVIINDKEQIIIDNMIYSVVWINKLSLRSGLCKGLQVDCSFIGVCSNYLGTAIIGQAIIGQAVIGNAYV